MYSKIRKELNGFLHVFDNATLPKSLALWCEKIRYWYHKSHDTWYPYSIQLSLQQAHHSLCTHLHNTKMITDKDSFQSVTDVSLISKTNIAKDIKYKKTFMSGLYKSSNWSQQAIDWYPRCKHTFWIPWHDEMMCQSSKVNSNKTNEPTVRYCNKYQIPTYRHIPTHTDTDTGYSTILHAIPTQWASMTWKQTRLGRGPSLDQDPDPPCLDQGHRTRQGPDRDLVRIDPLLWHVPADLTVPAVTLLILVVILVLAPVGRDPDPILDCEV